MRRLAVVPLLLLLGGCSDDQPADDAADGSADPPPVLLLPGYGGQTSDLLSVQSALEAAGREVRLVELDRAWPDFGTQVGLLDAAVGDADEVDVVGFSAGGLVARQWAVDGGTEVARRIVTLASPNHGTDPEVLGAACTGTCLQLLAGGDLVTSLNAGDETPAGPAWVAIWSSTDGVVVPPESAQLDGALDVRVQDVCPGSSPSHLGMLDAPVPALVVAVLDGDAAALPDASACEAG